jgi:hypothetical protein
MAGAWRRHALLAVETDLRRLTARGQSPAKPGFFMAHN